MLWTFLHEMSNFESLLIAFIKDQTLIPQSNLFMVKYRVQVAQKSVKKQTILRKLPGHMQIRKLKYYFYKIKQDTTCRFHIKMTRKHCNSDQSKMKLRQGQRQYWQIPRNSSQILVDVPSNKLLSLLALPNFQTFRGHI